ncbi:MAG TPA: hypothetical protein VGL19_06525 [Polyangiaceae bacterium]
MRHIASLCVLFALVACGGSNSAAGSGGASAAGASSLGGANATGGMAAAGTAGSSLGSAGNGGASNGNGGASNGGSAVGGGNTGGAGSGGASGGGASFADVQAIFDARCVICHDKSKGGLPTYPQLSLVAGDSHAALVNVPALEPCGGIYVVPGDPAHSYLMHKLSDTMPCDGAHMPAPFEVIKPPPLTPEQLASISGWISAGAH